MVINIGTSGNVNQEVMENTIYYSMISLNRLAFFFINIIFFPVQFYSILFIFFPFCGQNRYSHKQRA